MITTSATEKIKHLMQWQLNGTKKIFSNFYKATSMQSVGECRSLVMLPS
jgi:hypothetical protein